MVLVSVQAMREMGEHAHKPISVLPTMEAATHWLVAPLTQVNHI